jgi:subtilase family serine protease
MHLRNKSAGTSLAALAFLALFPLSARQAAALSEHNVRAAIGVAADQGRVAAETEQTFTVMLKLHDRAAFDQAVEELYNPESPKYHQWFTDADFARYAPTAAELKMVKDELVKQGFAVISTDPQNFSVRVKGSVGVAERAFQTELHTFAYKKSTFQARVLDAQLTGEAGRLVDSVVGLERAAVKPMLTVAKDPRTNKPLYKKKVTAGESASSLFPQITGTPLSAAQLLAFTSQGQSLPLGVFYGTTYNVNSQQTVSYTPKQLQSYYGLSSLIKQGYNGAGQTIALVEAYGYSAAEADANVAAEAFGLPKFTSTTFETVYPEGKPLNPNLADLTGWTQEIALDIQAAHAIAPGAKIVVVASSGQDNEDQIDSLQYIIAKKLANTVSSSWENDEELIAGSAEENAFNLVLERGAAAGISFQFSSGDSGDQGFDSPVGDLSLPANSPYATAVGGTSILNDPSTGASLTAGWGNDFAFLDLGGPIDPTQGQESYFNGGAGGGESIYFAKPSWQAALPGKGRQVPDVSALADPYTGFSIVATQEGAQYALAGIGGTSLASPVFTAIWAIADQYNGKPLGHAAPLISKLQYGEINDVIGNSDENLNAADPAGTIYTQYGPTFYSAAAVFSGVDVPFQTQTDFPSAMWNMGYGEVLAISFGTDSSLTVTPGWDNVTGYGEPNGLPFIQGVTGKTKGAAIPK